MNRQYFLSYAVSFSDDDQPRFGWTVISRNKPIETEEDLKDIQRELWLELKNNDVNVRLLSWRRMEQE